MRAENRFALFLIPLWGGRKACKRKLLNLQPTTVGTCAISLRDT